MGAFFVYDAQTPSKGAYLISEKCYLNWGSSYMNHTLIVTENK
jgi:hypothetical protein